ncbi:MAG: glycerate kinase [Acidimicrobiales bacterium]
MLLAAPDKFRGTATAGEAASAIARGAEQLGWTVRRQPLADGGEGLIDVLAGQGGERFDVEVTGPLGMPTLAQVLVTGSMAVIEMAQASGLALAGGSEENDPVAATSRGTGELIVHAAQLLRRDHGTGTVVLGLGGSASTDGGEEAVEAVRAAGGLGGIDLVGACDVSTLFVDAARQFGPQKGASDGEVALLESRLRNTAARYGERFGVDVSQVEGGGAAGGMGGAIVVLGGRLRSGYEVVADLVGLRRLLAEAAVVVTGEGTLDAGSFAGKVVGSVLLDAVSAGVPSLVVAGQVTGDARRRAAAAGAQVVSLIEEFGTERALASTTICIEEAVSHHLRHAGSARPFGVTGDHR